MLIYLFEVGRLKDDLVEMIFAIRVVLMSLGWAVMLISFMLCDFACSYMLNLLERLH